MKIAVFLPNWIGDAVMATPALRCLRQSFPEARLIGVLRPYITGVFDGSPWFDRLIEVDTRVAWKRSLPAAALRLRRARPDLALLFPNSFRTALLAWLGGCKRRIGYDRYGRGFLLSDRLQPVRDDQGTLKPSPIIDAYNRLVEPLNCPRPSYRMELFTTPRDEYAADAVWEQFDPTRHDGLVVCLNPGAAFGAAKHWSTEYFATLAQYLVDRPGAETVRAVLVLCGPKERALATEIASRARRSNVFALSDQPLSLGLTKACVRRADLLITTDSGPRHFAAAFGRPVLTLFGPTHIDWTETYYPRAVHLQKRVECGPCQLRVCPLDHRCMKLLTPEEVYAAALELLRTARPRIAG